MHVIAGKAVAFKEALAPSFKRHQEQVLANAKALANGLEERGFRLVTGGTDNHLVIVDLTDRKMTGIQATRLLDKVGITVNNNQIPFDPLPPMKSSGIRLGTPAMTTRGMTEVEMTELANIIATALDHKNDEIRQRQAREASLDLSDRFPIYPGILRRLYEREHGTLRIYPRQD